MSLSNIIQEIRANHKAKPNFSIRYGIGKDLLYDKTIASLTMILPTIGCTWNKCVMCGYVYDSPKKALSQEEIIHQFKHALNSCNENEFIVKIFTSGSFLDEKELPASLRKEILLHLSFDKRVKKVIVESRPEFIKHEIIAQCVSILNKPFEVAIGLETSNDIIRKECINKGFTFSDFIKASKIAHKEGASVKAYLLLKPLFLSEGVALKDALKSIKDVSSYADTISLNPCNVQKGTLVDEMFKHGDYRPPWLWSVVEVLKKGKQSLPYITLISHPVGAGSPRGPHNCGKCDNAIEKAIWKFSLSQNIEVFNVNCECIELWRKIVELEDFTFGSPLV